MADNKFILVEYVNSINNAVARTFKDMQRVKLTCLDVSKNYVIFGASSGGIYIFKSEPCEFIKLIPSKEGSAAHIAISPDEGSIALASLKGLVIILQNFLLDSDIRYQIYKEHEGQVISAMKWHNNELYCGDHAGRVSVITLMSLLPKTIFQSPSSCLMQLDSPITQIDIYLNYLLVSTKTKTYLCDTEKELYKQIGKKMRDGNFGACFCNMASSSDDLKFSVITKNPYKTVDGNEGFPSILNDGEVKIYCARPGARLWEANLEASVLCTYQFKDSFCQQPSELVRIRSECNAKLEICDFSNSDYVPENFSFGKIVPLCNRFILTFDPHGFYIFDPNSSRLIFWCNAIKGIQDIIIVDSLMYVWYKNLKLKILSVVLLEDLVLKVLFKKQYNLCAELCIHYSEDVLNLLECSEKIHMISILKSKIDDYLLEKFTPILTLLEKINQEISSKTLKNMVVVVDNHSQNDKFNEKDNSEVNGRSGKDMKKDQIKLVYKQFTLSKTHKTVEIPDMINLYQTLNIDEILELFELFLEHTKNEDNRDDPMDWCIEQLLKQTDSKNAELKHLKPKTLSFLAETFLKVNTSCKFTCSCGFPLPKTHEFPPKYYKVGCEILDSYKDIKQRYLEEVPYLYKYQMICDNNLNLPLLVQFNDVELFELYVPKFTYDTWDDIIKSIIKLKQGVCLNCGAKIESEEIITWTSLGLIMIESIGATNTTKLLKRYSRFIADAELNSKFYQACIFSSCININDSLTSKLSVDLMRKMSDRRMSSKFEKLLEKHLQKRYLGNQRSSLTKTSEEEEELHCSMCKLPINIPILYDFLRKDCGHIFHTLCFSQNNICNICQSS